MSGIESGRGPSPRLMFAGGDKGLLRRLAESFERAGYGGIVCRSTADGTVSATATYRPDLLLLETCIGGTSGYDVAERILSALSGEQERPAILFFTFEEGDAAEIQAGLLNAEGVVRFPMDPEVLIERVGGILACVAA